MIVAFILLLILGSVVVLARQPFVGGTPAGQRMERIRRSPQFRQGKFQNSSPTPVQSKEFSIWRLLRNQWNPAPGKEPQEPLPVVHTALDQNTVHPMIVWFGHSSYYIILKGRRILVDPVFSGHASPISFFGKSYPGTDVFTADSVDSLDAIIITHDHYDHLDHKSIVKLKSKTDHFYTSLGVGAHLERWGIEPKRITEFDWWESKTIFDDMELIAAPARHFSGRSIKRNNTLWSSFILKTQECTLYLGGDSGYDDHFKLIGEKFGPFDLAILECGQYNTMWPLIHMMPEEVVKAAQDLNATVLMPVHWGKFSLALHPWKEPIIRVLQAAKNVNLRVTTPRIGEPVRINQSYPLDRWWEQSI